MNDAKTKALQLYEGPFTSNGIFIFDKKGRAVISCDMGYDLTSKQKTLNEFAFHVSRSMNQYWEREKVRQRNTEISLLKKEISKARFFHRRCVQRVNPLGVSVWKGKIEELEKQLAELEQTDE